MDLATIIGVILGFGLIIGSMLMGGSIMMFVNGPGLAIVVGGTAATVLINEGLPQVIGAIKVALQAFFNKTSSSGALIDRIVDLAGKARKEGLVSLENEDIEDEFLARGVKLGVDGLSPEVITEALNSELSALRKRHTRGQAIFKFAAASAPAMGMIGTLIGLVQMLQALEDPAAIGPSMAIALLTTMYGAIIAFVLCGPIAAKLAIRSGEETQRKNLAVVGVESILKGDNSMVIQSKLESFLSPSERAAYQETKS